MVRGYELTPVACEWCNDAQWVLTGKHEVSPGVWIRDTPVACWRCVPLAGRAAAAGIPPRFHGALIEHLIEREGNAQAVTYARAWNGTESVVLLSRDEPGDAAYGTGKTHIACALLLRELDRGRKARFLSVQDFLETMKRMFDEEGAQAQVFADIVAAEPLLCLDDLGKEQTTDWSRAQLFRLIDARYRARRTTIITTNEAVEVLRDRLGGATVDRLNDAAWIAVGGTSMRGDDVGA